MALTVTIPGGPVQLSGNRVQVAVETSVLTGELYNLLLKTTSPDSSFPEGIDAIEPGTGLEAIFDIRNRVTLPLVYSFTWPLTGAKAVEQPQMAKTVAIDIGERYVTVVNDVNVNTVNWAGLTGDDFKILILKGGISKHQQAKYNEQNTTFYTGWIAAGKFLTLQPDNMRIAPGQPVKLWFITKEATSQDLTLKVSYTTTAGVEDVVTFDVTIGPGKMYEICAGPASLGLNPAETASYSVGLEKAGVPVSEVRAFTIVHRNYEDNTYLLFTNRIGGIDCAWLHGRVQRMFPTESERSQRDARIADTQQRPTLEVDYKAGRRKWNINTGHKLPEEMEALTALSESRNIWLLDGNDIIPVMLGDGDNLYLDTMNDLHDMDLIFTEAH